MSREAEATRYPRWLQVMVLPWLPITAVLFFFTVLRGEELVCAPETCVLENHRGFATYQHPVTDVRVENDADTKRPVLVVVADGVARFDLRDGVSPAFATYTDSRSTHTPARIPVGGRAWWGIFGGLLGAELLLVLFFTFARVRTPSDET